MTRTEIALAVLGTAVLAVVILQDTEAVETRLLFVQVTMPRAILLLVTFLLGGLVGMLGASRIWRGKRAPTDSK